MGPAVHDVLGSDVDDAATNSTARVEGQCLIFLDGEHIQLSLVDGSFIDGVGDRGIDQFAAVGR